MNARMDHTDVMDSTIVSVLITCAMTSYTVPNETMRNSVVCDIHYFGGNYTNEHMVSFILLYSILLVICVVLH